VEPLEARRLASAVTARRVFYNRSAFDGHGPRSDARDDSAVAPGKAALLPGETVTPANYTAYARGLNGVVVDIAGLPEGAALTADDFDFRVGNNGAPAGWRPAPAPREISVRPSPDPGGGSRVALRWRDRAIRNTWLQVTVRATERTGLPAPDVFYFGNLIGDAGDAGGGARVDEADIDAIRSKLRLPAAIGDPSDVDHNGRITAADVRHARRNLGAELYTAGPFPQPDAAPAEATPPALPGQWRLVFHDEFSAASLDPVWHPAQYWDHDQTVVGEGELEAYDPTGISLADGALRLTARRDPRAQDQYGVPYVSGMVMTGGEKSLPSSPRFSFRFGYMEVRARLPAGRGLWPAIWLMPASYDDDNGELDVVELLGQDPAHARFTLHRRGRDEGHGWDGPDLSQDFHTYAVDWQSDHVSWYVDSVERARSTNPALICPEAMYPILDLAVGGPAGTPAGETRFPASMDVDYIRIWQE
jgi:beta-glucanase (GH16 family)